MRVTEQSHEFTEAIDEASVPEMIEQIARTDRQMFGSRAWGAGLLDPILLRNLANQQESITDVLAHPAGSVIMSGAGTSGRLAMHAAATCTLEGAERVSGILAGGPNAFFKARERVEDQPSTGASDLKAALASGGPFVYVGITCGLSAPYVAGQVQTSLIANAESTIVIGFNRIHQADRRIHPGLVRPFVDILQDLERTRNGALLNPIIGPEPITGSTRMKSGSATRIMLDCLLNKVNPEMLIKDYKEFQATCYQKAAGLAPLITAAGKVLLSGGSIVYLGAPREGLLAMLDASECPPTFGAKPEQVRAYVDSDFARFLPDFLLDGHRFDDYAPKSGDLVIAMGTSEETEAAIARCLGAGQEVYRLEPFPEDYVIQADLAHMEPCYRDLALKWSLNLISTCAFIQYGKIYGNRMIDLRISNLKLWERAIGIVSQIGEIEHNEAEKILRSLVLGNPPPQNIVLGDLISKAVAMERVVATAILIARGKAIAEAAELTGQTPKLKDCLRGLKA